MRSLDAIAEVNESVAPVNVGSGSDDSEPTPVPDDTFQPDIIVLLTDGASNRGALPLAAAQAAVDRGVRVYTIGFSTSEGLPLNCTEQQLGGLSLGVVSVVGGSEAVDLALAVGAIDLGWTKIHYSKLRR